MSVNTISREYKKMNIMNHCSSMSWSSPIVSRSWSESRIHQGLDRHGLLSARQQKSRFH